jgi:hypothetical protein
MPCPKQSVRTDGQAANAPAARPKRTDSRGPTVHQISRKMVIMYFVQVEAFFGMREKTQGKVIHMTNHLKNLTEGENWQNFC